MDNCQSQVFRIGDKFLGEKREKSCKRERCEEMGKLGKMGWNGINEGWEGLWEGKGRIGKKWEREQWAGDLLVYILYIYII